MNRILIVEDEPTLAMAICDLLATEGYAVQSACDGDAVLADASSGRFDLIILDVMLPKRTGLDICRELREGGIDAAILMLSAKAQVSERVLGLRLGADDYLTKPFDPEELLARVAAIIRRVEKPTRVKAVQFGDVEVNFERAEVRKAGRPVCLAAKELHLLRYLVDHRERAVTREEILRRVWEYSGDACSRTVDVHVAWLRQKLEDDPQNPRHIETIRGKGYLFTP